MLRTCVVLVVSVSSGSLQAQLGFDEGGPDLEMGPSLLLGPEEVFTRPEDFAEPGVDAAEMLAPLPLSGGQPGSRWKISPHFDAKITYDDNIFIQPRGQAEDFMFLASPGLGLGFWDVEERFENYLYRDRRASRLDRPTGNFALANYTAGLLWFAEHSSENTVNHDAQAEAQWQDGKLTIDAGFRFQSGTMTDIDIGGRVDRKLCTANAGAQYQYSEKLGVETDLSYSVSDPQGFIGSEEWKSENWVSYLATPVITVGLGGTFGNLDVEDASSETYEQGLLRVSYRVTEKISAVAAGGIEFRQSGNDGGDRTTPVFSLGLKYTPAEGTIVLLDAYRRVENSALQAGRDYILTGLNAGLRRFVWRGIYLTLDAGYDRADYTEAVAGGSRRDDYFFVRPGILYNFASWGNAQLVYQHRENDSTRERFSFVNNQVEVQMSFVF